MGKAQSGESMTPPQTSKKATWPTRTLTPTKTKGNKQTGRLWDSEDTTDVSTAAKQLKTKGAQQKERTKAK